MLCLHCGKKDPYQGMTVEEKNIALLNERIAQLEEIPQLFEQALRSYYDGDTNRALKVLQEIRQRTHNYAPANRILGHIYLVQKDFPAAEQVLNQASFADRLKYRFELIELNQKLLRLTRKGQQPSIADCRPILLVLDEILKLSPFNTEALKTLELTYKMTGEIERDKLLNLGASFPFEPYRQAYQAYLEAGLYPEAICTLEKVAADPAGIAAFQASKDIDQVDIYFELGECYLAWAEMLEGKRGGAKGASQLLPRFTARDAPLNYMLAAICFKRSLNLTPDNKETYRRLLTVYERLGYKEKNITKYIDKAMGA